MNNNELEFIAEIQKNEIIYNVNHKDHKSKSLKAQKWKEIADKFGSTEINCKRKWKSLRDAYIKKLKNGTISQYRFGEALSFLNAIRQPKFIDQNMLNEIAIENAARQIVDVDVYHLVNQTKSTVFVSEIKKFPSIWQNSDEYSVVEINEAWVNLSRTICKDFDNISLINQRDLNIALRKKWQHLQSRYKTIKNNHDGNRKMSATNTALFNLLSFLDESQPTDLQIENILAFDEIENNFMKMDDVEDFDKCHTDETENDCQKFQYDCEELVKIEDTVEENQQSKKFNDLNSNCTDNDDSDKEFLLSLVDEMKKIPEVYRLDARLNILVILKKWQAINKQNDNNQMYTVDGKEHHIFLS